MGFLGLGGGKATVHVLLDRAEVPAGGTVQVTVRVSGGRKETEITEGRLRLVLENEYDWRESTSTGYSSTSSGTSSTTTTTNRVKDRKTVDEQRFLERGAIPADTPSEYRLSVEIPAGSPGSGEGKITRVRWKVQATLARDRARDISEEVAVEVLSPDDPSWVPPAEEIESRGDCDLSFRIEKRAFGAGEPIEGMLVLTPSAECHVGEVRVELERHENVPRGLGNEAHVRESHAIVAGALDLTSGAPLEYPFRLEVPPDPVPTLRTDQSTVTWLLKGVGARSMRRDYSVTQEVLVYSSPGSHLG
jgi:hypothetical protein